MILPLERDELLSRWEGWRHFAEDPALEKPQSLSAKLIDKLSQQRRQEILLEVRESNLEAQLFFKNLDFLAVRVLRNHYDDTTEDAYVMRYRLYETDGLPEQFRPHNRISYYDAA